MNFSQVNKKIYRGSEPTFSDLQEMKKTGMSIIVDLENSGPEPFGEDIPLEMTWTTSLGMVFYSIPMGQFLPPKKCDLQRAADLMFAYDTIGIFVHCKAGVDRTGMAVATYRMKHQGWSKSDAVKEMKSMGMHWWYYWWSWFL